MNDPEARLTAYALGEVAPGERDAIESQMATDPEARRHIDETRELATLLGEALARDADRVGSVAGPDLEAAISRRLGQTGVPVPAVSPSAMARGWLQRWSWAWGAAVAALLLIPGAILWWPGPLRSDSLRLAKAEVPSTPAPRLDAPTAAETSVGPEGTDSSGRLASARSAVPSGRLPDPTPAEVSPAPVPADELKVSAAARPSVRPTVATAATLSSATSPETASDRYRVTVLDSAPIADEALVSPVPLPAPVSQKATGPGTSPQPLEAMDPARRPRYLTLPGTGGDPELLSRYGLGPTPATGRDGQRDLSRSIPSSTLDIKPAPAPSGEAREASPTYQMSPQLMRRYGLVPSPGPAGRESLAQRYRTIAPGPEVRTFQPEEPGGARGANPGYVDVGTNPFHRTLTEPLSTFGLDVDTGSYPNVRRFLIAGSLPPPAAVRLEEMVNYFPYAYPAPERDAVFGVQAEVAGCPWEPRHRLVRIGIRARDTGGERPPANLVFLVDVSGSMRPEERLPLLKQALRTLVRNLSPADRVAIVTYASSAGVHLPSTSCERKEVILAAIDSLTAGGSTNGEGGIRRAYQVATDALLSGGVNRVLLCTDGDFNVGIQDQNELVDLIRRQARSGVFLTTIGVGTDNFKDALMRRLADEGNGVYHYVDSYEEAHRVLIEEARSTLVTVARDAKAQVEFNPAKVESWRLLGYEKRALAAADFNDDSKDAGEVGAGHAMTVLFEIVPPGVGGQGTVDPLKYQPASAVPTRRMTRNAGEELLTLKLRSQRPEGSRSVLQEVPVVDPGAEVARAGADFRFAAAVAAFAMTLRDPDFADGRGCELARDLAQNSLGEDPGGWRAEFLTLVQKARGLLGGRRGHR